MYVYIIKWFAARVAFFLAILLVLQPFLHAHIDDGYAIHGNGFHFVNEHEEVFSTENSSSILLSNTPHASHIISVDLSVREGIDALLFSWPHSYCFINFTFCPSITVEPQTQICISLNA